VIMDLSSRLPPLRAGGPAAGERGEFAGPGQVPDLPPDRSRAVRRRGLMLGCGRLHRDGFDKGWLVKGPGRR